jgi:hypothetical protein
MCPLKTSLFRCRSSKTGNHPTLLEAGASAALEVSGLSSVTLPNFFIDVVGARDNISSL